MYIYVVTSKHLCVLASSSLSILDLAPGSEPIRLTVYTKGAIEEIAKIKSSYLELMEVIQ